MEKVDLAGKFAKAGDSVTITGKIPMDAKKIDFHLCLEDRELMLVMIYFNPTELQISGKSFNDPTFRPGEYFRLVLTIEQRELVVSWQGKALTKIPWQDRPVSAVKYSSQIQHASVSWN